MIAGLLVVGLAAAAPDDAQAPVFGVSLGGELSTNDAIYRSGGVRARATLRVARWVELSAAGEWFPAPGDGGDGCDADWTEVACSVYEESGLSFDVSRRGVAADLLVGVRAVEVPLDRRWRASLGLEAGLGVVTTQDDDRVAGNDEFGTASQVHGAARTSLFADVGTERVSFRFRYGYHSYLETVQGTTVEMKNIAMLGGEVFLWFP